MSKDAKKKAERNNNEAKRLALTLELCIAGNAVIHADLTQKMGDYEATIERLHDEVAAALTDQQKLHGLLFAKSEEFEALQAKYDLVIAGLNQAVADARSVVPAHLHTIQEPSTPTSVNDAVTATVVIGEELFAAGA